MSPVREKEGGYFLGSVGSGIIRRGKDDDWGMTLYNIENLPHVGEMRGTHSIKKQDFFFLVVVLIFCIRIRMNLLIF